MKVEIGKSYLNKDGNKARLIIGLGSEFKSYRSQTTTDCVGYIGVRRDKNGRWKKDGQANGSCTRAKMQTWAKTELLIDSAPHQALVEINSGFQMNGQNDE
jgi:hypothetical protein